MAWDTFHPQLNSSGLARLHLEFHPQILEDKGRGFFFFFYSTYIYNLEFYKNTFMHCLNKIKINITLQYYIS